MEEWRKKGEVLRQIVKSNQTECEVLDWDKKIKEHQERIEKEGREDEARRDKAVKKGENWELLRVCRDYIQETETNGRRKISKEINKRGCFG